MLQLRRKDPLLMATSKKRRNKDGEENGVIITIYIESSTIPSRYNPSINVRRTKTCTSCGYDRRAQLLAYAQRLRRAGTNKLEWPRTKTKPKSKLWRSFRSIFRKRKMGYERIVTETINVSKKKGSGWSWRNSILCRKLMRIIKGCYGKGRNVPSPDDEYASSI